jgi:hypothetical protein
MSRHGSHGWRDVPPPCPVDDTPFTACTPESVARQRLAGPVAADTAPCVTVVRVNPPQVLTQCRPTSPPDPGRETFTTKTYRGKHPKPERRLPPHGHSHR